MGLSATRGFQVFPPAKVGPVHGSFTWVRIGQVFLNPQDNPIGGVRPYQRGLMRCLNNTSTFFSRKLTVRPWIPPAGLQRGKRAFSSSGTSSGSSRGIGVSKWEQQADGDVQRKSASGRRFSESRFRFRGKPTIISVAMDTPGRVRAALPPAHGTAGWGARAHCQQDIVIAAWMGTPICGITLGSSARSRSGRRSSNLMEVRKQPFNLWISKAKPIIQVSAGPERSRP